MPSWTNIFFPARNDREILNKILELERKILMNQAELAQALTDVSTQIQKGIDEVLAAVQNAGNVTPEVQAALDSLRTKVQTLDDINPDQP